MIIALHGFLGLASDWRIFDGRTPEPIQAHSLWPAAKSGLGLEAWTEKFIEELPNGERPLLIGYSMGGRLAMHAVLRDPLRFRGAIFVSAHPGLTSDESRASRLAGDQNWAARIRKDPWREFLHAWNDQPTLTTPASARRAIALTRPEREFDREALAMGMDLWSLGRQRDLRPELAALKIPHLFVAGASDFKFKRLLEELILPPGFGRRQIVREAGHRVPWDNMEAFVATMSDFTA